MSLVSCGLLSQTQGYLFQRGSSVLSSCRSGNMDSGSSWTFPYIELASFQPHMHTHRRMLFVSLLNQWDLILCPSFIALSLQSLALSSGNAEVSLKLGQFVSAALKELQFSAPLLGSGFRWWETLFGQSAVFSESAYSYWLLNPALLSDLWCHYELIGCWNEWRALCSKTGL